MRDRPPLVDDSISLVWLFVCTLIIAPVRTESKLHYCSIALTAQLCMHRAASESNTFFFHRHVCSSLWLDCFFEWRARSNSVKSRGFQVHCDSEARALVDSPLLPVWCVIWRRKLFPYENLLCSAEVWLKANICIESSCVYGRSWSCELKFKLLFLTAKI